MKKTTRLILLLLIPITYLIGLFSFDIIDKTKYDKPFKNEYLVIKIDNQVFTENIFEELVDYIQSEDMVLEKRTSITLEDGSQVTVHHSSLNTISDYNEYFKIANATDSVEALRTYGNINLIRDFLNNDMHQYDLLEEYLKDNSYDGSYYLHFDDSKQIDDLRVYLSETYNIADEDYSLIGVKVSNSSSQLILIMMAITLLLLAMFVVSLIFDLVNNSKKLGVKRLFGYNVTSISKEYISTVLLFYIPSLLVATILSIFVAGFNIQFISMMLVFHFVIVVIVTLLVYLISQFVIRKVSLSDLLKNIKITNITFSINLVLKIVTVILIVLSANSSIDQIKKNSLIINRYDSFSDYNDLLIIRDIDPGDDADAFIGGDSLDRAQLELYNILNKDGSVIYADFSVYSCMGVVDEPCYDGEFFQALVDFNYIEKYRFLTNQQINEIETSDNLSLIIPASDIKDQNKIIEELSRDYELNENTNIYTYESVKAPTLNPEIAEESNFIIKNPILVVFNSKTTSFVENRIQTFGNGMNTPAKIINIPSNVDFMNIYQNDLSTLGLDDNISSRNIFSIKDIFINEVNTAKNSIYISIGIIVFAVIINIFVSLQNTSLYLLDNSKKIGILYLFGYEKLSLIKDIILLGFMTDCVGLLIGFLMGNKTPQLIIITLLVAGLSMLTSFVIASVKYKKSLLLLLKGEQL